MDENKFGVVYRNFEELIKEHKNLFKLFRKSKNPGLLRAIWSARDVEIEFYKDRLKNIEKSNHQRLNWKYSLDQLSKKFSQINQQFSLLKFDYINIKEEARNYKNEFLRYKNYSKSLESALKSIDSDKYSEESQKTSLSEQLMMVNKALMETDHENQMLLEQVAQMKEQIFELQDDLKWEKSKNRQHLRINQKMENELYRLNNQKEQQAYLN